MTAPPRSIPEWTLPKELVVLNRIVTELSTLNPTERRRVLYYINDRYAIDIEEEVR